jgi:hypothetical protein
MNDTILFILFMAVYSLSVFSAFRVGHAVAKREAQLNARHRRLKAERE